MSDEESRDDKYKRQTNEQYALLGKFVQAFEQMVDSIRTPCLFYLTNYGRHQQRINVVLHHNALGAQALFEIYRALIVDYMNNQTGFDAEERKTVLSILSQLAQDFSNLIKNRNYMLHGTWYIGWANETTQDFSEISVHKFVVTAKGLEDAELPTNVAEMRGWLDECDRIRGLISVLGNCTIGWPEFDALMVRRNFKKEGKKWVSLPTVSPSVGTM